ncbi:recombinase family protein [Brevibacillus sp. SYSU BS000544]|uniref:recombinase family protein n=1 Tax=Brevibacillus sp. SYSU BS000544 TaxID=3416443 RepID=UPI003CE4FA02
MVIGYARSAEINGDKLAKQLQKLLNAGASDVIQEYTSGIGEKPELNKLLERMSVGDTLLVSNYEALGRETREVTRILALMKQKEINLIILDQIGSGA